MSCPDAAPLPGSVEDLETQKLLLESRIRAKKNEDFLDSGRLVIALENMCDALGVSRGIRTGKSWEELFELCISEGKRISSAYADSLWKK